MKLDEAQEILSRPMDLAETRRYGQAVKTVLAAIERVRQLHSPDRDGDCPACGLSSYEYAMPHADCPTIAALDAPSDQ